MRPVQLVVPLDHIKKSLYCDEFASTRYCSVVISPVAARFGSGSRLYQHFVGNTRSTVMK